MVAAVESELTALLHLNEIYEGTFKFCPLQKFGFGFYKRRGFFIFLFVSVSCLAMLVNL